MKEDKRIHVLAFDIVEYLKTDIAMDPKFAARLQTSLYEVLSAPDILNYLMKSAPDYLKNQSQSKKEGQ
jgi:hypothetical protein